MLPNSKHRAGGVLALSYSCFSRKFESTDRPLSAKIACLPCSSMTIATRNTTSTSRLHFIRSADNEKNDTRPFCEMNFGLTSLWRREDKRVAPLTLRLPAVGRRVAEFRKSDTPGGRCGKPMPRVGQPRQVYLYRSIFFYFYFLLKSNVDIVLYRNRGVDLMDYYRANKNDYI